MTGHLAIRAIQRFPVAAVEFDGILDLGTAALAQNALRKHLADQPAALVADLTRLVVRDTAALAVLRTALRAASDWPGVPMIVLAPDDTVRAALRRLSLHRQVPVVSDPEEAFALAATHPAPRRQVLRDLPPEPRILRQVRRVTATACDDWGIAAISPVAQLVVGELLTNAIEHARTPCDVSIALRGRFVHIMVEDRSPVLPRRTGPDGPTDPRGRGLLLVDDLAAGWGSLPTEAGKLVWAMVRVRPEHGPRRGAGVRALSRPR
jgi:anti-anti-sigma regulatory factor